jgi:hypothetical protein
MLSANYLVNMGGKRINKLLQTGYFPALAQGTA